MITRFKRRVLFILLATPFMLYAMDQKEQTPTNKPKQPEQKKSPPRDIPPRTSPTEPSDQSGRHTPSPGSSPPHPPHPTDPSGTKPWGPPP